MAMTRAHTDFSGLPHSNPRVGAGDALESGAALLRDQGKLDAWARDSLWLAFDEAIARSGRADLSVFDGGCVDTADGTRRLVVGLEQQGGSPAVRARFLVAEIGPYLGASRSEEARLAARFADAGLSHFLLLDPDRHVLVHYWLGDAGEHRVALIRDGRVRLGSTDLDIDVAEVLQRL